ncbi:hypothetical protein ACFVR1_02725 [Psychrobacillus sp. NPDC058041]|uniref:hypothetical protein n=1 Tax=Psychrobacillus sp. NPDC058041 TaxID=3346310 RepID=UPI0036DF9423
MSEWKKDEEALDELLNNMPKFTDQRSKEDVYERVKMEIENQKNNEKRRTTRVTLSKWLPFAVSIASILILTFLVSSFFNDKESSMSEEISNKNIEQNSSKKLDMRSMDTTEEASITNDATEAKSSDSMMTMSSLDISHLELVPLNKTTSVYEESLNGRTVFHFSLIENALSVPITIIIPKKQMEKDFPNMIPSSIQLYERYGSRIDEEALGFDEYHPYKGNFIAEGKILKHYLPENHGYDIASGTLGPYWSSINEIFNDFDSIEVVNEAGSLIEWNQVGTLNEPSKLDGKLGHHNYFNYVAQSGKSYLSPNFSAKYDSISEAFLAMKESNNDIYTSVIPSNVTYDYSNVGGKAIIRFTDPLDFKKMDSFAATRLIEAFALTAASFGTEVKLENVVQQQWAEFDLSKFLPIPLGPNGFIMEEK